MRVKNQKLVSLLFSFLTLIMAVFLFVQFAPTKIFADTSGAVKVAITAGGTNATGAHSIAYPADNKGENQTVYIQGFAGQGKVIYSMLKEDSDSYVFNKVAEIDISTENPTAAFTYNFFANGGVGTYRLKAVIVHNNVIVNTAQELKFTVQKPESNALKATLKAEQIGTTANDFPQYQCSINVVSKTEVVDLSNYTIEWYYNYNGKEKVYCGSGDTITWAPENVGIYKLYAQIDELEIAKEYDVGEMTKNFSVYAIIGFSVLGAFLTAIAIISTVRKVKKERVW